MAPHTPTLPSANQADWDEASVVGFATGTDQTYYQYDKRGSVLFIYANNKEYMAKSSILPNQTSQELFTEACESEQTVSAHL